MNFLRPSLAIAIAGSATALAAFQLPAAAFTVTQNSSSTELLSSLLGSTSGLSNFSVTTTGESDAFGLFKSDPFGFGSGVVLSTGNVTSIPGVNTVGGAVGTFEGDASTILSDDADDIRLNISFDADNTVNKLFLQYVFASEEFVESAANNPFGAGFNDLLEITLNGVNLAKLSDGKTVTISNLVPNAAGPYHPDYINNPPGVDTVLKLDGYTKALNFEGLLKQGERNSLSIRIADVNDSILDSAVFLKAESLSNDTAEAVPEPLTVMGTVAAVALGAKMRQRRSLK